MTFAERQDRFDRLDAFLAARARFLGLPRLPAEPTPATRGCPDCGSPLARRVCFDPAGTAACEHCGWEELPG